MSRASVSVLVYGIYLVGLSLTLFAAPDFAAKLVGLEPHKDVWVYVAAMIVLTQSVYFFVSARSEALNFFRATVPLRYLVPVFFAAFALFGLTKYNMIILAIPDPFFATWTLLALRADKLGKTSVAKASVA
jgi:hypothetical protein